jgi:anti-anti-sigma factor
MSEFDMCSSAVLGILVTLRKRVLAAGGTLSLTGVQPLVREKLEITKLHTLFPDMQEPAVEAREETAPK